jgi:hypothetical protein
MQRIWRSPASYCGVLILECAAWPTFIKMLLETVIEQENLDFLDLAQPAIIGDKERGT